MKISYLSDEPRPRLLGRSTKFTTGLVSASLEHVYSLALERELVERGHTVQREVIVMITYTGKPLTTQRLDMVVDHKVVVENKSTSALPPSARRQTLNYLKASTLEVGFILHFGPIAKFYRIVRTHPPSSDSRNAGT